MAGIRSGPLSDCAAAANASGMVVSNALTMLVGVR